MKVPWRRKIRIQMDDSFAKAFIKNILSESEAVIEYKSMFQYLRIDKNMKDLPGVRKEILEWLRRRQ